MEKNDNNSAPFEKYKKEISQNKRIKRNAIIRGLFFLFLCIIITYIGKFRPKSVKTVTRHGLLIWVFKTEDYLSTLIIYPNDDDYQNRTETGERIFIHPLESPVILEKSHIHYNKKDLYLLGKVNIHHVKNYCSAVDKNSFLYFQGNADWVAECPRAKLITALKSRLTSDWSVQSELSYDTASGAFNFNLEIDGQKLIFATDSNSCANDKVNILCVYHDGEISSPGSTKGVYLTPGSAIHSGRIDSGLILDDKRQAIGIRLEKSGQLELKKIWLEAQAR